MVPTDQPSSVLIQRGRLLLMQERFAQAETELRRAVGMDPQDADARLLLAEALERQDKLAEATEEATEAIRLAPDDGATHARMGSILSDRNYLDQAELAATEAIRLDPSTTWFYALLASICMRRHNWAGALAASEQGLAIWPDDAQCLNMRAAALVQLGRRDEAAATLGEALSGSPEDAFVHANRGWTLLHEGNPGQAQVHFREALRLEPGNEWARLGIIEALKAKNPIYRGMLAYFLWMGRLKGTSQYGVIIAVYIGQRLLGQAAASAGSAGIYFHIARWLLVAFIMMTWLAVPLFNTLLRMSKFGRHVLGPSERAQSNVLVGSLLATMCCVGWWVSNGFDSDQALVAGFLWIGFGMLATTIYDVPKGWPRQVMMGLVAGWSMLAAFLVWISGPPFMMSAFQFWLGVVSVVFVGIQLGTPLLGRARPKR